MTVHERLADAGLIGPFDEAIRRGDRAKMVAILARVEIDGSWADGIADRVLADPEGYFHPKFKP